MQMIKLKPCPFCNGNARFVTSSTGAGVGSGSVNINFRIECKKCGATMPETAGCLRMKLFDTGKLNFCEDERMNSADVWNRRVGEADDET